MKKNYLETFTLAGLFAAAVVSEFLNYSTTHLSLSDLLGDMAFGPIPLAILLAASFALVDTVGLIRLIGSRGKHIGFGLIAAWWLAFGLNMATTLYAVVVQVYSLGKLQGAMPLVMTLGVIAIFAVVRVSLMVSLVDTNIQEVLFGRLRVSAEEPIAEE